MTHGLTHIMAASGTWKCRSATTPSAPGLAADVTVSPPAPAAAAAWRTKVFRFMRMNEAI